MVISYKSYGLIYFKDDEFLALAGGLGLLGNGIFRFIWSNLSDKLGFKCVNIFLLLIQATLIFILPYAVQNKWAYFFVAMFSIMCEGGIASMLPGIVIKKFGGERGIQIYSFMISSLGVSAVIGAYLFHQYVFTDGYDPFFMASLILTGVALLLTVIWSPQRIDYRAYYKENSDAP